MALFLLVFRAELCDGDGALNVTEPTYSYVKGEGWVITPERLYTTYCKSTVRLEQRRPLHGERWFRIRTNGSWFVDGKPDYDGEIKSYLRGTEYSGFNNWIPTASDDDYYHNCTYFVVVPV